MNDSNSSLECNGVSCDLALCQEAARLHNLLHVQLIQWAEIVLDLLSICSMLFVIRTKWFLKIAGIVNPNLKLIGCAGIFLYLFGISFSLLLHAYFKVLHFSFQNECDFVWETPWKCLAFRIPVAYAFFGLSAVNGFNLLHVALSLERARMTFCKTTSDGNKFGWAILFLMLITPVFLVYLVFRNDDFVTPRSYCLANSNEHHAHTILFSMAAMAVSDASSGLLDIFIYLTTWKRMQSKLRGYDLPSTFRLRETQLTMRLIIPFALCHTW
ncbi:hypothetical protein M3Y99_00765300 [Aphelenchoides fujianensis]|nr:hypothetical protein M3Y99_00765300 [Aphelenchoides fujianensis]